MIGIYNRFCRKCNENNCKQRKKRAFFCWNAIIYNIRNLPYDMLPFSQNAVTVGCREIAARTRQPLTAGGRKETATAALLIGTTCYQRYAGVECGLPILCHLLTQGEVYSLSNAFPTHALGI